MNNEQYKDYIEKLPLWEIISIYNSISKKEFPERFQIIEEVYLNLNLGEEIDFSDYSKIETLKEWFSMKRIMLVLSIAITFALFINLFTQGLFQPPDPITFAFTFICVFIIGIITFYIISKRRICPKCKKEMEKWAPGIGDYESTYKHFCRSCFVYYDTGIQGNSGS